VKGGAASPARAGRHTHPRSSERGWVCNTSGSSLAAGERRARLMRQPRAARQGTIEGRRDIAGGRLAADRRAAGNSTSGQCFTSLVFSADGAFLLAAGASKCAPCRARTCVARPCTAPRGALTARAA